MWSTIVLMVLLMILLCLAVKMRVGNNQYRANQCETIDSPVAQAIAQLLGIAGGIYLSLVMGVSFLGIDQPNRVMMFNLAVDPLAFLSILLAFVQPIAIYWLRKIWS